MGRETSNGTRSRRAPRKVVADPQPFVVRRSPIQGRGGFATRAIRKGERIIEYTGERIDWKTADARYEDDRTSRHHTFLFAVTRRTVIDGAVDGNDSRFINHSCAPNCDAIDEKGRIYIEAARNIAAGEELFYDYSYARDKSTTEEDEQLYVCRCGAPRCRGTILEAPPRKKRLPATHHSAARHPHDRTPARTREEKNGVTSAAGSKRKPGVTQESRTATGRKAGTRKRAGSNGRKQVRRQGR